MLSNEDKVDFIAKMHTMLVTAMTMVFVNQKDSAVKLQAKLKKDMIEAKILTG
jgi:hypothetical protein